MLAYHDSLMASHQGFDRTYHLIRLKYFWKKMYNEIKQYVASCKECQTNKNNAHSRKAPLKPLPCDGIFQRIHIDLYGPLPKVNGYKYVLVIVDAFSKWVETFPVKTLSGAEIAKILYSEHICRWGAPKSLLSDRGTNFLSTIVVEVCKIFKIKKYKTSPWHPQTNATAERKMSSLGQTLRMYIDKHQQTWPDILPSFCAAMRATPSIYSTLFSPYKILMGEEMRLPIDTNLIPNPTVSQSVYDRLQEITQQFSITREVARNNIKEAQERNKRYHDRNAVKPTFILGDRVMITNMNRTKGLNPKLQAKKLGPFYITDVDQTTDTYLIRDCETHKQKRARINADRLTKFVGDEDRIIQPPRNDDTDTPTQDNMPDPSQPTDTPTQDNMPGPSQPTDTPTQDNMPGPSQPTDTPKSDTPTHTQPTTSQQTQQQQVDNIQKCTWYKRKRWYRVKWVGQTHNEWVLEETIPTDQVRHFHVTKTQNGKARKAKNVNKV